MPPSCSVVRTLALAIKTFPHVPRRRCNGMAEAAAQAIVGHTLAGDSDSDFPPSYRISSFADYGCTSQATPLTKERLTPKLETWNPWSKPPARCEQMKEESQGSTKTHRPDSSDRLVLATAYEVS